MMVEVDRLFLLEWERSRSHLADVERLIFGWSGGDQLACEDVLATRHLEEVPDDQAAGGWMRYEVGLRYHRHPSAGRGRHSGGENDIPLHYSDDEVEFLFTTPAVRSRFLITTLTLGSKSMFTTPTLRSRPTRWSGLSWRRSVLIISIARSTSALFTTIVTRVCWLPIVSIDRVVCLAVVMFWIVSIMAAVFIVVVVRVMCVPGR
jgi:hypothetical protein